MSAFDKKQAVVQGLPTFIFSGILILYISSFKAINANFLTAVIIFIILSFFYIVLLFGVSKYKLLTSILNDYFLVQKYPWSKYHFIGQRKGSVQSPDKSCRQIIADFSKQGDTALSKMKSGETYLMYTHTTVVHKLRKISRFKITEFNDKSALPLMPNFQELIGRDCKMCSSSETCFLVKRGKTSTTFCTVKIEVR